MAEFSRMFGAGYDYFMYFFEKFFLKKRRARLLSNLSGKILEIGVGTGVNFEHYRNEAQLTGIEPSPYMLIHAEKKRDMLLFPDRITLHNVGCGSPDMEGLIPSGSLDAVVCTLVLCTIPDPEMAIARFMEWLKPGGRLVVLEHIRSHKRIFARIQDTLRPVWEKIGEGCQLNRPTDKILKRSGFHLIREDRFTIGVPFYEAEYQKPF